MSILLYFLLHDLSANLLTDSSTDLSVDLLYDLLDDLFIDSKIDLFDDLSVDFSANLFDDLLLLDEDGFLSTDLFFFDAPLILAGSCFAVFPPKKLLISYNKKC